VRRPDKVAIFIDGGFLRAILRDYFNKERIDFLKLSDELSQGCERFRTYYYISPPYQSQAPTPEERKRVSDMDRFLYNLRQFPRFEVRLGKLRKTNDHRKPFEQKGVDVLLSIDLVQLSVKGSIDQAILVTGDSDFCPAVRVAKDNQMVVKLLTYPSMCSDELFSLCDERVMIDNDLINKIKL